MYFSLNEALESTVFQSQGFSNIVDATVEGKISIRANVFNREDFVKWKNVFSELTRTSLNSEKLLPSGEGYRRVFAQRLICQHATKHKGVKKTYTG